MSDTKTLLEQIKDEYAQKEYGYQDWAEFLADNRDRPKSVDNAWSEVSRRYATACCMDMQENISKHIKYRDLGEGSLYEIEDISLLDPENIVLKQ